MGVREQLDFRRVEPNALPSAARTLGHRQVNGTDCAMKRIAKGAEFMRRGGGGRRFDERGCADGPGLELGA